MADLLIKKKNEVYLVVDCDPHIQHELQDQFTFEVPGAKFMPQYRSKYWDGKIRLFNIQKREIYVGLLDKVCQFCKRYNYTFEFKDSKHYGLPYQEDSGISRNGVKDWLNVISKHTPRDYQIEGVYDALKRKRRLIISPTGSGKSLMIYAVVQYHAAHQRKILVIVPTTSLVEQMYKDFQDYGWDAEHHCHRVYAGTDPRSDKDVIITTWQSVYKLPKVYFEKFGAVIGDEAHLFKAKSLTSIMNKLYDCKYRVGFTGTLDGMQTNRLVLEGVFGSVDKITRTEKLIKEGHLSEFEIKVLILKHNPQTFDTYQQEMDYLVEHENRSKFIRNLVCDLTGNTLVLFNYVERHGMPLFELINNKVGDNRLVFLVHGGIDTEDREKARQIAETTNDSIIVASYGTFSTGINIRNLHNVVFASPSKSKIRNLQSIGRVLRRGDHKSKAVLYDIADDISKGSKRNYTLNHLVERIKIYNEENFNYEFIDVRIKN